MRNNPTITVLMVEPHRHPYLKTVEHTLENLQAMVGGYIEVYPLAENVAIVCNEEGKMNGMELNRPIYHNGEMVEIIAGTFFIAGDDISIGEFVSLTDEQIAQYSEQFKDPVHFFKLNSGRIVALPR